eukprot:m.310644 g.310644  ORF g.310644 m.310644 type:complete len:177 (+) comp53437_c0_seq1:209-739(+)
MRLFFPKHLLAFFLFIVNRASSAQDGFAERKSVLRILRGRIGGDNFTYFPITPKFDLTIVVDTLSGDADLYVGEDNQKPHYLDCSYSMTSATYGREMLAIPKESLKKPIVIGVLGHVSSPVTEYRLAVLAGLLTGDEVTEVLGSADDINFDMEEKENSPILDVIITIVKLLLEALL